MRYCVLTGICVVLATCIGYAHAQSSAAPFYVGAPVAINNVPVDTSKALKPPTNYGQNAIGNSSKTALGNLNFANFFKTSSFSLPSFPSSAPSSPVMPQASNVFQPTLPKGKGPLDGGKVVSNAGQSLLGTSIFGSK